jgi:hypothetical protein
MACRVLAAALLALPSVTAFAAKPELAPFTTCLLAPAKALLTGRKFVSLPPECSLQDGRERHARPSDAKPAWTSATLGAEADLSGRAARTQQCFALKRSRTLTCLTLQAN